MNGFRAQLLAFALVLGGFGSSAQAQQVPGEFDIGTVQSPVLVIEFERAFGESAFGKRFALELEQAGAEIAAENRQIEAELTEEEQQLTEQRQALDPQAFRELADAFDQKVQKLRREQDTKARALVERQETARRDFLISARPVLNRIMQDAGAVVVMDKRNVFATVSAIDVTDQVILGINQLLAEADKANAPKDAPAEEPSKQDP